MKVLANVSFIILIICLILSLIYNLSPNNINGEWKTVGFVSFLGAIDGAPTFDIGWVDKYITVKDLKIVIPILPESIINFIDNWLLAPFKLLFLLGTTAINAITVIGYWVVYVFNPIG